MNLFKLYLSCILIATCTFSKSQDYSNDAACWVNIYLQKKLNEHFNLHLNQQDRINNNVQQYGYGYADLGVTYRYNKHLKCMVDYVYARKLRLDRTYTNRHQAYIALIVKETAGLWTFNYRNMVQYQVQDYFSSSDGKIPGYYERNKVTVKYELNKYIDLYMAEELYLPFYHVTRPGLDQSRSFAGMFYNLSKRSNVEFYFLYQQKLHASNVTKRDFVYGIGYSHAF